MSSVNNATNLSTGTAVTVQFSEALAPTTVMSNTIQLLDSSGGVAASVSYNSSTNTATLSSIPVTTTGWWMPAVIPFRYTRKAIRTICSVTIPRLGGYTFNLGTKGLAAGTYTLYYKARNDPTLRSLTFVVG